MEITNTTTCTQHVKKEKQTTQNARTLITQKNQKHMNKNYKKNDHDLLVLIQTCHVYLTIINSCCFWLLFLEFLSVFTTTTEKRETKRKKKKKHEGKKMKKKREN